MNLFVSSLGDLSIGSWSWTVLQHHYLHFVSTFLPLQTIAWKVFRRLFMAQKPEVFQNSAETGLHMTDLFLKVKYDVW